MLARVVGVGCYFTISAVFPRVIWLCEVLPFVRGGEAQTYTIVADVYMTLAC